MFVIWLDAFLINALLYSINIHVYLLMFKSNNDNVNRIQMTLDSKNTNLGQCLCQETCREDFGYASANSPQKFSQMYFQTKFW